MLTLREGSDLQLLPLHLPLNPTGGVWMGPGGCVCVCVYVLGGHAIACRAGTRGAGRGVVASGTGVCVCTHTCRAGMRYVASLHMGQMHVPAGPCVHTRVGIAWVQLCVCTHAVVVVGCCTEAGACVHSCMGACGAGDVPHGWVWVAVGAGSTLQEGSLLSPLRLAAAHGPKITALQEVLGVLGGEQRQGGVVVIRAKVLPRRGVSGGVLLP